MSLRQQLNSDFFAIISLGSSIAAWQEQLEWGLKILAALVAIVAGVITIYQRLRHRRAPRP